MVTPTINVPTMNFISFSLQVLRVVMVHAVLDVAILADFLGASREQTRLL
jgi:hypothetical protein